MEFSIVIATYNRAEQLRVCLECLASQTQPAEDFEVIVVVDGSTDGTLEMLNGMATPFSLTSIWQPNSGQSAALNRGVEAAKGRFCLLLDDDIRARPDLVASHLRSQLAGDGILGVGQLTLSVPPYADWFSRWFQQLWLEHYGRLNRQERPVNWDDCYSGNLSFPRESFLKVGGFELDLPRGYDIELAYRLVQQGLQIVYLSEAIGEQDERKDFRGLISSTEKQGAGSVEIYSRHPPTLSRLFGSFYEASLKAVLLKRTLLALKVPPTLLFFVGPLLGNGRWGKEWYKFLQKYAFWRGVQRAVDRETWARLTGGTVILLYHAIGYPGEKSNQFILSKRSFSRQMAWLKRLGCRVISLEEYLRCQCDHRLPPARSIVITFDDGYADNRELAAPVLRRFGFPATIFVVSGSIGERNGWDEGTPLTGRSLMNWADLKELAGTSISIGAHTRTHPFLTSVLAVQAREEIQGSRQDLEQELGESVILFSYPYGQNDVTIQEFVREAGFLGACTIHRGKNRFSTPRFALHRTEVYGTDSLLRFLLSVRFIDDNFLPPRKNRRES